jgi:hypothetical protein
MIIISEFIYVSVLVIGSVCLLFGGSIRENNCDSGVDRTSVFLTGRAGRFISSE